MAESVIGDPVKQSTVFLCKNKIFIIKEHFEFLVRKYITRNFILERKQVFREVLIQIDSYQHRDTMESVAIVLPSGMADTCTRYRKFI